jgi:hypothetical protein
MADKVKTGKKLERRVADAYRQMGAWKVEHDVELGGNQIDVYVELATPGRLLHRIAVEAKDYAKPVGIRIVNEYADIVHLLRRERLIDRGIIVSSAGFSKQARNAAKTCGIRLLEIADLEAMAAKAESETHPWPIQPSSNEEDGEDMEATDQDPTSMLSYGHEGKKKMELLVGLLSMVLVIIIISVIFSFVSGRNVLVASLLFSEMNVALEDTPAQVFDEKTGKFLVESSTSLQIEAICYGGSDYSGSRWCMPKPTSLQAFSSLPVDRGQEGWKIRLEHLLDMGLLTEKDILFVPQEIELEVTQLQPNDNPILVFVLTDEVYAQQATRRAFPLLRKTFFYHNILVGQRGVLSFIDLDDCSMTSEESPNIVSPGTGPLAAIVAVEFEDGRPILRSKVVFVLRKGILYPDDIWFDRDFRPYISQAMVTSEKRKVAFQSTIFDASTSDIVISNLDGSETMCLASSFFHGSEEVICGWGDDQDNHNFLYFLSSKEGGNVKVPYKVIVEDEGVSKPIRLETAPPECE